MKEMVSFQNWLLKQKSQTNGLTAVRMTNAMTGMNNAIREKYVDVPKDSNLPGFKLKRFTTVDPRTSTKRGDNPFYLKQSSITATEQKWAIGVTTEN